MKGFISYHNQDAGCKSQWNEAVLGTLTMEHSTRLFSMAHWRIFRKDSTAVLTFQIRVWQKIFERVAITHLAEVTFTLCGTGVCHSSMLPLL